MSEESNKLLFDILSSIDRIELYLTPIKSFAEYQKHLMAKDAVERQLSIMGESASKLLKLEIPVILSVSNKLVSIRNRLVHAYDSIDDGIVWGIWKDYIKPLKIEVLEIISGQA